QKGVSLYLWYNSNGYWNDAPQGPRGIMDNTIARRKEMAWLKSIGVKGIKVDFFGGDKQVTLKLYEDILYDANEYGVLCIFHGATLPRGWERMYPNFASSEAVLASENLAFSQQFCNKESFNATLHPFIRNAVGSMDYGGSALNKFYNGNNTPNRGSKRMTSDVYALATSVLFQSPVQHFALAPNNLTDAPDWAINFMKEVPTTWDEVKFIDGYPGKCVILARRHGTDWYIVAINAEKETLKKKIKLPMLNPNSEYRIYADDEQLNGKLSTFNVSNNQEVEIAVPFNGAVLIVK
ncbi:MAG: glycoside hydrolase family 97 catalytic domain-containing protein, partial [Flectobacillus sp.]|nr:glycoside hydrolase family 97 catalytic domain-containing protein [Flectobacillus sp.]